MEKWKDVKAKRFKSTKKQLSRTPDNNNLETYEPIMTRKRVYMNLFIIKQLQLVNLRYMKELENQHNQCSYGQKPSMDAKINERLLGNGIFMLFQAISLVLTY